MTGSLARDGQGGMTAELPLANAGFSYASDPNTGMHRTGADAQAIECGGVDIVEVDASGATVNGNLEVTGTVTSGGSALIPIGLGPLPWSGLAAPPKWVLANGQSLLRASYPALWAFAAAEIALGNTLYTNGNGTTTFTVTNMNGRVPAAADPTGTILTSATMTPDGNTLGAKGGTQVHTLTTAELAAHSHGVTDLGHTHAMNITNFITSGAGNQFQGANFQGVVTSATATNSVTGISINNAGSGAAHLNVQPTIVTNYIIYAGD